MKETKTVIPARAGIQLSFFTDFAPSRKTHEAGFPLSRD
jgi:hypothetical protein